MSIYRILTNGPTYLYDVVNSIVINETTKEPLQIAEHLVGGARGYKFTETQCIRILLGTKCNYDCSYCSQGFSKEDSIRITAKDINNFLGNLDKIITPSIKNIEFWGGEPLVYIKYLYKLVPAIRKQYPEIRLSMISNGSLFTKEVADFCIENLLIISFSHDAYAQTFTRGDDFLASAEMRKLIIDYYARLNKKITEVTGSTIRNGGINCILSKNLNDPVKANTWFQEIFEGKAPTIFCELIMPAGSGQDNSNVLMNQQELEELAKNVYKAGMQEPGEYPYSIMEAGLRWLKDIHNKSNLFAMKSWCGMPEERTKVIDLKFNVFTCQNYVRPEDARGNALERNLKPAQTIAFQNRLCCTNCPLAMICRGSCPQMTSNAFAISCWHRFYYSMGIFAAAFRRITGYKPLRIEGNMILPQQELISSKKEQYKFLQYFDIPQFD